MQFYISDAANLRLNQLAAQEFPGSFLRVSVLGGGCSGFEYKYEFEQNKADDDYLFQGSDNPISVIIDPLSSQFLENSTLDYTNAIGKSGFKVINPKASGSCGCGKSFAFDN